MRGEESRSRQSGRTCLGLAVVRAIVHAHHGRAAWLPGTHGGTCFRLWLPEAS